MVDKLLIIDLETTGLEPQDSEVIELGAILYSVKHGCILQQLSTLFPVESNSAQYINKIDCVSTLKVTNYDKLIDVFLDWADICDYIVAHNAQFDRQWFGIPPLPKLHKPWLCTYNDFIWRKNHKKTNLINTALNHGVAVNSAHRALTDCQLIATIFDKLFDFNRQEILDIIHNAIKRSFENTCILKALVSYNDRDLAKNQDFRWDKPKRIWTKSVKACDYLSEVNSYEFKCEIIEIIKSENEMFIGLEEILDPLPF